MLKKIINTLFTKGFSAIAGFLILLLVSHLLGSYGKGQQAVIVLNINIFLYVLTLIGNSTLIYLAARKNFSEIFIPSILWSAAVLLLALPIIRFIPFFENTFAYQTIIISFIASITEINYYILMGKEKVIQANRLKLIYPIVNLLVIGMFWLVFSFDTIEKYIVSLYAAYILSALYGIYLLKDEYKSLKWLDFKILKQNFKTMFVLGGMRQLGSIAQMMTYRLSLWFLPFFFGKQGVSMAGIYSNATSMCDSVLLFGTSLALVQYSTLSNTQSNEQKKLLTIKLTKVNGLVTFAGLIILCLLPKEFWLFLFGSGFETVGYYIRILAFGELILSLSSNVTQYFASRGNFSITCVASIVGMIATVVLGYILIPKYQIVGAAITAVVAYSVSSLIELIYFLKWIRKKD